MRSRSRFDLAVVVAVTLFLGWVLSLATTRVVNWFVMTDELYYLRLAVSVAQTGSPLPRIHGEIVANVNQLYPVLLSPVFGDADVPGALAAAHRLNAFVMVSAAIPVYVLARRIGVGRFVSVWAGVLAVAVPWIVLASFLLTEVVAYPAFCWALLAIAHAVERASSRTDLVAFAAIAVAVLARTQFVVLAVVFVVAVLVEAVRARMTARRLVRSRPVLAGAYFVGLLVAAGAVLSGNGSRLLGSYGAVAKGLRFDLGLLELVAEHVAVLALGLAILPFLVGAGWLIDRVRPSAGSSEHAFATVGCATLLLLTLEVASFDQRFGAEQVKDRYLFYVVPIVLVAVAAALRSRPAPWWAYAAPAAVCAVGFATLSLPLYEKLNVDSPLAILNGGVLRLATSQGWAQALLALATFVALQLLLLGRALLPARAVAFAAAALLTFALPAETVYAFKRLFAVDGTNGLPITLDQGGVFNWVDRALGEGARVTMVRYPVNSPEYWAGVAYWWDVEFWNEAVVDTLTDDGLPGPEPWVNLFDRRTGAATRPAGTKYLLMHGTDVRFRIAGKQVAYERGAYVFELDRPSRATWFTDGIYPDGWTRPHTPATITVFAEPGQQAPVRRFLTIAIASPDQEEPRPLTIVSNLEGRKTAIPPASSVDLAATVCVPAGGSATVTVETPIVSDVYRDPTVAALTGETDRPAGILLRSIALADETEEMERCP